MNANEILDMIGDAKGTYLWETQKYRDGTAGAKPLPRLWLVAAVIGLMLLLVGCTVAYVLRLQDLKVAEYRPTTPTVYDENGDVISLPTLAPRTQITLQGANQEALAEWNSFCQDYDPDGAIVTANDNNELGIPNRYYIPYGCYSWEMVNKLDEIVQKYDLKLLSPDVGCQSYESSVLFPHWALTACSMEMWSTCQAIFTRRERSRSSCCSGRIPTSGHIRTTLRHTIIP